MQHITIKKAKASTPILGGPFPTTSLSFTSNLKTK